MTDAAPAASAPAPPPQSVPIDTNAARIPNPAETGNIPHGDDAQRGQPATGSERRSIDDIIKSAHEKVTKDNAAKEAAAKEPPKPAAEVKPKAEPETKPEAQRKAPQQGPDGRFQSAKPQEDQPAPQAQPQRPTGQHADAPTRFSADAKAEWANAPESVRAEVHRMHREFDAGFQKYRGDAEAYNTVRDFDEFVKGHGGTLRQVLTNYATLEQSLVQGDAATKDAALAKVFQRAGINPREWAAKLLGQPVDQRDAAQHSEITGLRAEIASLKAAVGGVASHVKQQQATAITDNVTSFAKANPRFDELSDARLEHSIQTILKSGLVPQNIAPQARLQKAYELADRLNPAAQTTAASSAAATPPANGAGSKSIAGSPANGSDPSIPARKKGERTSIDDSIKRARARAGV